GQQLLATERFGDVVVRTRLQPRDGVPKTVTCGQDHHRDVHPRTTDASQYVEPVGVGQTEVQEHELETTGDRVVDRLTAGADDGRGEPVGVQALADERRDTFLVLDDEDSTHACSLPEMGAGMTRVNVEPAPGADRRSTRPRCPSAMARTMARPRPAPDVPLVVSSPREKRAKTRPCSSGGIPGPWSVTQNNASPSRTVEPTRTVSPGSVCRTAFAASCTMAWVMRCGSSRHVCSPTDSRRQARSPSPRSLASMSLVSSARDTSWRWMKSGCRALASSMRSSTIRPMRSSSSVTRRITSWRSW